MAGINGLDNPMERLGFTQGAPEATNEPSTPTPPPAVVETPAPTPAPVTLTEPPAASPEVTITPEISFGSPEVTQPVIIEGLGLSAEQVKAMQAEYQELKAKSEKSPYNNDMVRAFNEAQGNNIDPKTFFEVYNADTANLTNIEKLILKEKWESGLSEESARLIIEDKFKLGLQERAIDEATMTAQEVEEAKSYNFNVQQQKRLAAALMEKEVPAANKFLSEHKAKALTPAPQAPVITAEQVAQVWKPAVSKMPDLSVAKIGDFTYNTPREVIDQIDTEIYNWLATQGIQASPDNDKAIAAVAQMREESLWAKCGKKMLSLQNAHFANKLLEYKNNPTPPLQSNADKSNTHIPPAGGETPEQFFKRMKLAGM